MTLVTDGPPLSLPVMQPKWGGGVPSVKPCSTLLRVSCPQDSATVRTGDSGWMRPERPMVWCCFFVHAQVSSLQLSRGWTSSRVPPKSSWAVSGAEVWESTALFLPPEKLVGYCC